MWHGEPTFEGMRTRMGKRERARRRLTADGAKKPRRSFTAEYKLQVVEEARKCRNRGEIGQLLEREGLSYSQVSAWRKVAEAGAMKALGRKRGPKPSMDTATAKQIQGLKRDHKRLRKELLEARAILVAHRKVLGDRAVDPDDLSWPEDLEE